jgi:hypothetical protein
LLLSAVLLTPLVAQGALPEADLQKLLKRRRAVGLPAPVGFLFLPTDLKVVGPPTNERRETVRAKSVRARAEARHRVDVHGQGVDRTFTVEVIIENDEGVQVDGWRLEAPAAQMEPGCRRSCAVTHSTPSGAECLLCVQSSVAGYLRAANVSTYPGDASSGMSTVWRCKRQPGHGRVGTAQGNPG